MEYQAPPRIRGFAIVPAAGRSRRMGQDKLLMPWGTATVIESVLAAWKTSAVDEVVVVSRQDQTALTELCREITVVVPPVAPPEMKDSVLAALSHIRSAFSPTDNDVWLLAPADMPQLDPTVVNRVLSAHDPRSHSIVVPTTGGKRGHPVLFPWRSAAAVAQLRADQGVNALLDLFPVREVECGNASIHGDLDTLEDYERLRRERGR